MSVDGVWPDLGDGDGLRRDAVLGRDLGFTGKSMIHPGQIAPINEVFSPTANEVDYARRLITDFEQAVSEGRGSISFGGQLVDRPIYERARATVRLADRTAGTGGA
jgi:citrate lyase subunit beta/citryl-CoA lyase